MGFFSGFCGCLAGLSRQGASGGGEEDDADDGAYSFFFSLQTLQIATNFFSELNQLGSGGFGPVFKGLMPDGVEIAVKKLSLNSRQGDVEFCNEVKLLLRIQHKNLVTLLGCCIEGPEKMLVYEYMPNKSLDKILFDETKLQLLDWEKRFRIITGIVRGLLYLHEEAPERIIHRDIKAANILLDEHLNPKISDFGMARLFPEDDTHLTTFKVTGTYGYLAPEYALRGFLSVKADVFSFGVLVLEIVCGRKNHDKRLGAEKIDLLRYVWDLFQAGKTMDLVDTSIDKLNPDEAAMCIQLGLLCCQSIVSDRPEMNSVHLMLSSNSFTLPTPGKPALLGRRGRWTTTTSTAFTRTNPSSSRTAPTKARAESSFAEEHSRNSASFSSVEEGR